MWDSSKLRIKYRRALHIVLLAFLLLFEIFNKSRNIPKGVVAMAVIVVCFFIGDSFSKKMEADFGIKNKYRIFLVVEIIVDYILQLVFAENLHIVMALVLCTVVFAFDFLTCDRMYDRDSHSMKKMTIVLPLIINIIVKFSISGSLSEMCAYLAIQILAMIAAFFMADFYISEYEKKEKELSKLTLEKGDMERANEQLREYQDKIKSVNEQINYQKIDLSRAINELERVNAETESQTEVMRYMASTFNITKCMSSIADAVMNIRKAKICALFVDGDAFMSKFPSSVINTNYTSMQSRLNKELEKIYHDVAQNKDVVCIYRGESLKDFKFIGEVNINSLGVWPINNGEKTYGVMLVGSDKEDYFEKGLSYFDTCLAEFNIAVKSIRLYLQMQDMARKDGLTGIYNRVYFSELFKEVSDRAVAKKTPLSVALFDIDKFKNVNDTYGHLAGDEVIKMVAHMDAKYAEKHGGFACRYGGEEFLLVLPDYDEEAALAVLEEMHEEIKTTKVLYNDIAISVNCCIGLSVYPNICDHVELLVNRADKAMYYGKKTGRGRLVLDNPGVDDIE